MENVGPFIAIWNILRPFGIFYGRLVIYVCSVIWYIYFHPFGTLYRVKSGNLGA
jgi:hypothetical protein